MGRWLASGGVDVGVGAGLLALPLLAVVSLVRATSTTTAVVGAAALALVVNGPHFAATWVRAWRHGGSARLALQLATLAAVVVALVAHAAPQTLPWLFTAYLAWSPWHYAMQNHHAGLVLFARQPATATATTTAGEQRALKVAHGALAVGATLALFAGASEPLLLRAGWPVVVTPLASGAGLTVALVAAGAAVVRLRRRGASARSLAVLGLPLSATAVWFAVPGLLPPELFGSTIAAAAAAAGLGHCAQSLWLSWFVEGRAAAEAPHDDERRFDGVAWYALVVAGGIVVLQGVPWFASRVLGHDLLISLLIAQAVVNLHHMFVDVVAWQAGDPRLAALLAGDARALPHRERVSNARAAAFTLPLALLLALGAVDTLQLVGTRDDADDAARARALAVNPNDSRAWVQEAAAALAMGDVDAARAALGRAVALSTWNPDAQLSLLELHVATDRDDEAAALLASLPAGVAALPTARLVAAGIALRKGRADDAVTHARAALAVVDGGQPALAIEARGLLGAALLQQGKPAEALVPLKDAVADATARRGEDPLSRGDVPDLGLALAGALLGTGQHDAALVDVERVLQGAEKTNRVDVGVRALLLRAQVFLRRDDARTALEAFQLALRAATDAKEAAATSRWKRDVAEKVARGWLDYGGLLAKSEAPMRARLACALLARAAARTMPAGRTKDDLAKFIDEAADYVAAVVPKDDVDALGADLDRAAADALALRYPDP